MNADRQGDIGEWLGTIGLAEYTRQFREAKVLTSDLPLLEESDLEKLGIPLGPRKRLLRAIEILRDQRAAGQALDSTGVATRHLAERRQITILFCDMVGSTALAATLDPEALRSLIAEYQRVCGEVIRRYDGFVAQYLGDGLMAYFGWPSAHEDDAERSVRAALDLVTAVKIVSAPEPIRIRVGIATGTVVVGASGDAGSDVSGLAVGETPNLAARLQGIASPDEVIVAPGTRRLLRATVEVEDLGVHRLKGIVEPVQAWRVSGLTATQERFDAARIGTLLPLVGRTAEKALLRDRWQGTIGGSGQVVLVSGEPGIGKSRLLRYVRDAIAVDARYHLALQCSPHHGNTALRPYAGMIRRSAGLDSRAGAAETEAAIEEWLASLGIDPGRAVPLLDAVLSVEATGRHPDPGFSPQRQKEETLLLLVDLVARMARRGPVLLVVEDAHWIDPTSLEATELITGGTFDLPVMVLMSHRPEFAAPRFERARVTALSLDRLRRAEAQELMVSVAGDRTLPEETAEALLARTDGVPLFIEEFARTVLEGDVAIGTPNGHATGTARIPATLQDSLMARLDRLGAAKEIAQIAACVGREFPRPLLAALRSAETAELDAALERLVSANLVFRKQSGEDAVFVFKHALVQDAASGSLLTNRRQAIHAAIARTIENQFPERAGSEPEVLAHHFAAAGLGERAIDYFLEAGRRAVERFANPEAVGHLNRGIECLRGLPAGVDRDRQELLLQATLGTALGAMKGYTPAEVGAAFQRARELCDRVGDMPRMFPILYALWLYFGMRAEYPTAFEVARQLLELAERHGDTAAIVAGRSALGGTEVFGGDLSRALAQARIAVDTYTAAKLGNLVPEYIMDPGIFAMDMESWALLLLGRPDEAELSSANAEATARRAGHPVTLATVVVHAACLHCLRRSPREALQKAREAVAICKEERILLRQVEAQIIEGWAMAMLGDVAQGVELLRTSIGVWDALGARIANPMWFCCLAEASLAAGRTSDARSALSSALDMTRRHGETLVAADVHRVEGLVLLQEGGADSEVRAQAAFRTAIDVARRQGARFFETRAEEALAAMSRDAMGRPGGSTLTH